MITHDTTPNASYITNRSIHRLKGAAMAQWADLKDVNEVAIGNPFTLRFYFNDGSSVTQQQAQAFMDAHNNSTLASDENNQTKAETARTIILQRLAIANIQKGDSFTDVEDKVKAYINGGGTTAQQLARARDVIAFTLAALLWLSVRHIIEE